MRIVRFCMSTGDGAALWPKGCTSVADCPAELVMAVSHANYILRVSEQLMEDEHPPHWKWAFDDEINAHMERVKRQRDAKFGHKSSDDGDEPPTGWAENDYARNLR